MQERYRQLVRVSHTVQISLQDAADMGCRACGKLPAAVCQFLGTAATSQVVGEALGMRPDPYGVSTVWAEHLVGYGTSVPHVLW